MAPDRTTVEIRKGVRNRFLTGRSHLVDPGGDGKTKMSSRCRKTVPDTFSRALFVCVFPDLGVRMREWRVLNPSLAGWRWWWAI